MSSLFLLSPSVGNSVASILSHNSSLLFQVYSYILLPFVGPYPLDLYVSPNVVTKPVMDTNSGLIHAANILSTYLKAILILTNRQFTFLAVFRMWCLAGRLGTMPTLKLLSHTDFCNLSPARC